MGIMLSLLEEQKGNPYDWCVTDAEKCGGEESEKLSGWEWITEHHESFGDFTVSAFGCHCKAHQKGCMS